MANGIFTYYQGLFWAHFYLLPPPFPTPTDGRVSLQTSTVSPGATLKLTPPMAEMPYPHRRPGLPLETNKLKDYAAWAEHPNEPVVLRVYGRTSRRIGAMTE